MDVAKPKMKQDVATRWNSGLLMLVRICLTKELLSAVITAFPIASNFLNVSEWKRLRDSINVLKPIAHLTISLVVPIVRGLQYAIRYQQNKTT